MKTYTSEFTYLEFIEYCKNTPRSTAHNGTSSEGGNSEWTKTKSLEESYSLALDGWDAGLNQIPLQEGVLSGSGIEFNSNVHGSVVNVGNYLMGLPDNMWEMTEKREYNLEELVIYVPLVYSAHNDGEKAMRYCKEVIKVVNDYQSRYDVKLVGVFDSNERNCVDVCDVVIKDFGQRFVLNNVAFAFHPSFFRRIWFRYIETKPYLIEYGYGSTRTQEQIKERVVKANGTRKSILLNQLNNTGGKKLTEKDITKINF